ncbi:MAG TPA: hypothetical protein VIP80_15515 [Gemmatimonadales bacterium]|jgi:hypothetical protein
MTEIEVKTLFNRDRLKKVVLVRRQDGAFSFAEWHFLAEEGAWAPVGHRPTTICDSLDRAEAEARGRIEWLVDSGQADA